MVSIQVDEVIAEAIEKQARDAGVSVSEYLRLLVPLTEIQVRPSWEEIEQEIVSLSSDDGFLPDDFSRADIYNDHD